MKVEASRSPKRFAYSRKGTIHIKVANGVRNSLPKLGGCRNTRGRLANQIRTEVQERGTRFFRPRERRKMWIQDLGTQVSGVRTSCRAPETLRHSGLLSLQVDESPTAYPRKRVKVPSPGTQKVSELEEKRGGCLRFPVIYETSFREHH